MCVCRAMPGSSTMQSLRQNKKSRASRTSIVCTFSSLRSAAVSLFVFISTQTNVYAHRGRIQERPELPPPADDPPAAPVRRGIYCFSYALSLAIALSSTSFEISVIITHVLVGPNDTEGCWGKSPAKKESEPLAQNAKKLDEKLHLKFLFSY